MNEFMAITFISVILLQMVIFFFFIYDSFRNERFFHRDLFKKKYEFRTPHALKMCFLSILIIFHTMLLSGMITNIMTIMHA